MATKRRKRNRASREAKRVAAVRSVLGQKEKPDLPQVMDREKRARAYEFREKYVRYTKRTAGSEFATPRTNALDMIHIYWAAKVSDQLGVSDEEMIRCLHGSSQTLRQQVRGGYFIPMMIPWVLSEAVARIRNTDTAMEYPIWTDLRETLRKGGFENGYTDDDLVYVEDLFSTSTLLPNFNPKGLGFEQELEYLRGLKRGT